MQKTICLQCLMSCTSQKSVKSQSIVSNGAEIQLVSDIFSFTEGPAADRFGNVYFTDQPNDKIYFWDWKTNKIEEFLDKTGRANGTFFDQKGNLLTCSDENGEIWKINEDGVAEVLTTNFEGKRLNGPNDLWVDENNGIYFTDPLYVRDYWTDFKQEIQEKNLYYRNSEGKITKLDTFTQPNGIVGGQKLKKLYVSDIDANKTYVYDISYLFSNISLKILKATAGSFVVPDFEITFTEKSLSPIYSINSFI